MSKINADNLRRKHEYQVYLEQAKGLSDKSVDLALAAIDQFEASTGHRSFKLFHVEQALKFKRVLQSERSAGSSKPLSQSTINARLNATKAFFIWIAGLPGYRRNITYADCEYFSPRGNEIRIAHSDVPRASAELDQIKHAIANMPSGTDLEKRDRAVMAVALVGCLRIEALVSLRIVHVDLQRQTIHQDASVVATKFRKSQLTDFFPVGDEIVRVVTEWVTFLTTERHFGRDEPLLPATRIENIDGAFKATGLDRSKSISAQAVRDIFKSAYAAVDLPYYHPHTIRHTVTRFGEGASTSQVEMVAISQNLGHANPATTFGGYGAISRDQQRMVLRKMAETQRQEAAKLGFKPNGEPDDAMIAAVVAHLTRKAG